jgi:hypothetical protein
MGLDYIRNTRGKPWRKQWAQGLDLMKQPSLFDLVFGSRLCSVSATIEVKEDLPSQGDALLLQLIGSVAVIFDGQRRVARVEQLPQDILKVLHETDDIAVVTVEHVGIFGDVMEISLK